MDTLLITGGCGFIGSHTSLLLLNKGFKLIIIDSNINSSSKVISKVIKLNKIFSKSETEKLTFVKGDIRDKGLLDSVFINARKNNNPINAVIHFAGLKYVNESIKSPLKYWDVNVNGTRILIEVMLKQHCYKLVFSSSASIYEPNSEKPITEKSNIKPINPYGYTKASSEKILDNVFYSMPNTWKIIKLRYFNPAGADSSGILGEDPKGVYSNLFPKLSEVAFNKSQELEIFGNDWPTKDGTCIRDYIHISDLADAHYQSLLYLMQNKSQLSVFNLGSGHGLTLMEILKIYSDVNSCQIPYIFRDRRDGDVPVLFSNIELIKQKIGWQPKRSIEDICRDSWNWQSKNIFKYND